MSSSKNENGYEMVTHPAHYNRYSLEAITALERLYGTAATALWCEMTAMKYRLRMGVKPGEDVYRELEKEHWYLTKRDELRRKLEVDMDDTPHEEEEKEEERKIVDGVDTTAGDVPVEYTAH